MTESYSECIGLKFKNNRGLFFFFFFQAEDGIRNLVRSRGLGDVYKCQVHARPQPANVGKSGNAFQVRHAARCEPLGHEDVAIRSEACHLNTSDAAEDLTRVDLGWFMTSNIEVNKNNNEPNTLTHSTDRSE